MNKNEMTISEIKAMYFDDKALMLSPYQLFRYHFKGDRFYYYIDTDAALREAVLGGAEEKPKVRFAVGVTTLTRKTIPADEFLTKWIAEQGWEEARAYRDLRAFYGSLLHTVIATMLIKRVCNLDLMGEVVHNYCKVNGLTTGEGAWADDIRQDTLAFAQFCTDYNVKPLAIELSLVSPALGVAGTLDIFCEMDYTEKGFFGEEYKSCENKGKPKESKRTSRVLAIIDNKSGRNSTGGVHNAAQLRLLRMLLNDAYPQYNGIDIKLYNWHPKDWRTRPTYTLVDQNNGFSENAAHHIIGMYGEMYSNVEEKTMLEMFGTISLDQPVDADGVPSEAPANFATPVIKAVVQQAIDNAAFTQQQYDYTDTYFDENQPEDGTNSLP
jgi:hypothetical protein